MNYSEMSDFEINCAVAKALGYNRPGFLSAVLAGEESEGEKFDPCNSWADAGPIIQENKISIFSDRNEQSDTDTGPADYWWNAISFDTGCQHNGEKNPLRAAMIVFLMMKEADNG